MACWDTWVPAGTHRHRLQPWGSLGEEWAEEMLKQPIEQVVRNEMLLKPHPCRNLESVTLPRGLRIGVTYQGLSKEPRKTGGKVETTFLMWSKGV